MKQAIIYFKNGKKDWIDPIDDDKDVFYGESTIIITSALNQKYVYDKDSVDKIELVEFQYR